MFPSGQKLASHEALVSPLFSSKYPQVPSDVATDLQVWWSSQKENDFGRREGKKKRFTFQMILQKVKTQVSLKINF